MRLYPELAEPRSRQITRDVLVLLAVLLFAVLAWAVHRAVMSLTAISEGFTSGASDAQDTWNGIGDALAGIPLLGDAIQQSVEDLSSATFGNAAQTGQSITDAVTLAANVLAVVTFAAPVAVLLVLWLPRRLDRARAWDAAHRVLAAMPAAPAVAGGAAGVVAAPGSPVLGSAAPGQLTPGHPGTPASHGSPQALTASGMPPAGPVGGGVAEPGTGAVVAAGTGRPSLPAPDERHDTVALPWGPPARATPAHPIQPASTAPIEELLALRALCHLPFEDLLTFTPRPFEAFAAGDYAPLVAALYAHEGLVPPGWSTRP